MWWLLSTDQSAQWCTLEGHALRTSEEPTPRHLPRPPWHGQSHVLLPSGNGSAVNFGPHQRQDLPMGPRPGRGGNRGYSGLWTAKALLPGLMLKEGLALDQGQMANTRHSVCVCTGYPGSLGHFGLPVPLPCLGQSQACDIPAQCHHGSSTSPTSWTRILTCLYQPIQKARSTNQARGVRVGVMDRGPGPAWPVWQRH